jgi:hypothetical protein
MTELCSFSQSTFQLGRLPSPFRSGFISLVDDRDPPSGRSLTHKLTLFILALGFLTRLRIRFQTQSDFQGSIEVFRLSLLYLKLQLRKS